MTVQDLMDILNNTDEIPSPEDAELCFYLKDENGEEIGLELKAVGAFDISTDITFTFAKAKKPVLIRPIGKTKPQLKEEKRGLNK